jgi:hypothetical protein
MRPCTEPIGQIENYSVTVTLNRSVSQKVGYSISEASGEVVKQYPKESIASSSPSNQKFKQIANQSLRKIGRLPDIYPTT